ncbi:SHOCT domain-containing protein [Saccharopolyspora hirsuta]|uniref:SHOCT domain-containing protein n=1 Tax=Saccharopolyspora hirsuta TaxID=1837 RepID=A0A5M7CCF4_SACHI|nr:SHOCT domain-containing protein [Saccharopolyspora hirsuta]KAA5838127.1 SHOCT domain-containing protein [Saccharopolyspora hirsuta]
MLTQFLAQWSPVWHGPHGGPGWPIGLVFLLLIVALVGVVVWSAVRGRPRRQSAVERAREILAERYARGEISSEEYRERLGGLG